MKKLKFLAIGCCLLAIGFATTTGAQSKAPDSLTVKGEVLDMNCYMDHGAHGAKHAACAANCLKEGGPVGILSADGKVYLIVADHTNEDPYDEIRKHPGEQIAASGKYSNRGGIQALIIESLKTSN